ncbi:MAG: FAD-binding protein [Chloroflexi bacterium]|nr:MAG: FAD-binding protein [Chloroflexota bacterium]
MTPNLTASTLHPATAAEIQEIVRQNQRISVRGGGSKPALSTPPADGLLLDLAGLTGLVEYEPAEFTFTAQAGTRVAEIQALLAQEGQYMPFDPPLAQAGATLGGVIAAGTSGAGRVRYGGVRDFLIGVRFVDGRGEFLRGGGKVVKNAAGFDYPKLFVGSLGRLGILTEVTFKVFPEPPAYATLALDCADLPSALGHVRSLNRSKFDINGLDFGPNGAGWRVWVRLGGFAAALDERLAALRQQVGGGALLTGAADASFWQDANNFDWLPADTALIKIPVTPGRVSGLEESLAAASPRRYSVSGNLLWLGWERPVAELDALLTDHALSGLLLRGGAGQPWLGKRPGGPFLQRVKMALDPDGKFGAL